MHPTPSNEDTSWAQRPIERIRLGIFLAVVVAGSFLVHVLGPDNHLVRSTWMLLVFGLAWALLGKPRLRP